MSTITQDMTDAEAELFKEHIRKSEWGIAAKMVAIQAHAGQMDFQGVPYINHPQEVALLALEFKAEHHHPQHTIAVAWMHDVIEDSGITAGDLLDAGFPPIIVEDVEMLSRPPGVIYRQFIERLATEGSDTAITVKMADLAHNTDPDRPVSSSLSRRYALAQKRLLHAIAGRVDAG